MKVPKPSRRYEWRDLKGGVEGTTPVQDPSWQNGSTPENFLSNATTPNVLGPFDHKSNKIVGLGFALQKGLIRTHYVERNCPMLIPESSRRG
jgi:hypothetical protein